MRDILICSQYGGFGLSEDAIEIYLRRCGKKFWKEDRKLSKHSSLLFPTYWLVPPDERPQPVANWFEAPISDRVEYNRRMSEIIFTDRDVPRDDHTLIEVVRNLGLERSAGKHCELKIVAIPDDVDWVVEEYDGKEWVAERHRTWS